jgi:hypothetical protein
MIFSFSEVIYFNSFQFHRHFSRGAGREKFSGIQSDKKCLFLIIKQFVMHTLDLSSSKSHAMTTNNFWHWYWHLTYKHTPLEVKWWICQSLLDKYLFSTNVFMPNLSGLCLIPYDERRSSSLGRIKVRARK